MERLVIASRCTGSTRLRARFAIATTMLCGACAHTTVALDNFADAALNELADVPNSDSPRTLAIVGFRNDSGQRDALARAMEDELASAGHIREHFTLVERDSIAVAVREVTRQITDPLRDFFDDRTAVAVGNFVHAHYVLTGSWRPWTDGNIRVVMRLLAVETATVVAATAVTVDAETIPQEFPHPQQHVPQLVAAHNPIDGTVVEFGGGMLLLPLQGLECESNAKDQKTKYECYAKHWQNMFGSSLLEGAIFARLSEYFWLHIHGQLLPFLNFPLGGSDWRHAVFMQILSGIAGLETRVPILDTYLSVDAALGAGWWGSVGYIGEKDSHPYSYGTSPSMTGPGGWLDFEFADRLRIGVRYGYVFEYTTPSMTTEHILALRLFGIVR